MTQPTRPQQVHPRALRKQRLERLQRALAGPVVAFTISTVIILALGRVGPRDLVGPLAVGLGLGVSTYLFPAPGRRRRLGFSLALGALAALTLYVALRTVLRQPA